jgi:hypothetical protein
MVLAVASWSEPTVSMAFQGRVIGVERASRPGNFTTLHFSASQSLGIPCDEADGFSGVSRRGGHTSLWLELRFPTGLTLVLEEAT